MNKTAEPSIERKAAFAPKMEQIEYAGEDVIATSISFSGNED